MTILVRIGGGLRDNLRDVPWEGIFKLGASAAAIELCEWVQVEIDVYIRLRKYQVKNHSSPWFSVACAAAIVHRNHFFCLYQKDKSSDSKVKFRQTSNRCKSNRCLLHLIKQNCLLKTFLRILILMTQVSLHLFSILQLI